MDGELWQGATDKAPLPLWFTEGSTTPVIHSTNVRKGLHPLGSALGSPLTTCGTCIHLRRKTWSGKKTYLKCSLAKDTNGPGTDVRARWRGCTQHATTH